MHVFYSLCKKTWIAKFKYAYIIHIFNNNGNLQSSRMTPTKTPSDRGDLYAKLVISYNQSRLPGEGMGDQSWNKYFDLKSALSMCLVKGGREILKVVIQ